MATKQGSSSKERLLNITEQSQLQNAATLIHSNLFKLQIEQLLSEVHRPKTYSSKVINNWIDSFVNEVRSTSASAVSSELLPQTLTRNWLRGTRLSKQSVSSSTSIEFAPITDICTIGSFDLNTITHPIINVDIAFVIPDESLGSDFKLYLEKRSLYVAAIYEIIANSKSIKENCNLTGSPEIILFKNDPNKPIIELSPDVSFKGISLKIRLFPTVSSNCYSMNKVVRSLADSPAENVTKDRLRVLLLVEDCAILAQHRLLSKLLNDVFPVAKAALVLLKVWLTQRAFRFGGDSLDAHCMSLLLCYLLYAKVGELKSVVNLQEKHGKSNAYLSGSWDQSAIDCAVFIFQNVLEYLESLNLEEISSLDYSGHQDDSVAQVLAGCGNLDRPSLCKTVSPVNSAALQLFHPVTGRQTGKSQDVIKFNCLWRISMSSLQLLRQEAAKSLAILKTDGEFAFSRIFMEKSNFFNRFDLYLSVNSDSYCEDLALPSVCVSNYMRSLCIGALGNGTKSSDRIRALGVMVMPNSTSVTSDMTAHVPLPGDGTPHSVIHIGIVLNPDNILRKVDRGPAASACAASAAAAEESDFQQFWGPRCQLRRFQDGSIVEAVVWDDVAEDSSSSSSSSSSDKKRKRSDQVGFVASAEDSIPERILKYIFDLHGTTSLFSHKKAGKQDHPASFVLSTAPASKLESQLPERLDCGGFSEQVDPRLAKVGASGLRAQQTTDSLTRKAIEALDQLRDIMTSKLTDMPLGIMSLMAACPELRYTSLYPALPHPFVSKSSSSADGTLDVRDFGGHTISLCVQTLTVFATLESSGKWQLQAEARQQSIAAFHFRIADLIQQQFKIKSTPQEDFIDIYFKGFVFRVHLVIPEWKEREEFNRPMLCSALSADEFAIPHHQAIRNLCSLYPSYAGSVRLFTQWLDSNMLSGHITVPMVEVLVASAYINDCATGVSSYHKFTSSSPTTSSAGFLRTLYRICEWNWEEDPLCVNLTPDAAAGGSHSVKAAELRSQFVEKFHSLKREVVSSGIKYVLPAMCIAGLYSSGEEALAAASASSTVSTGYIVDPESIYCIEPVVLRILVNCARDASACLLSSLKSTELGIITPESLTSGASNLLNSCNIIFKFRKSVCSSAEVSTGGSEQIANICPLQAVLEGASFARSKIFANMSKSAFSLSNLLIQDKPIVSCMQSAVVDTLRKRFGDSALFFFNASKADLLGVVWKPKSFLASSKTFNILDSRNALPIAPLAHSGGEEPKECVVMNIAKVVSDMIGIGEGVIADIIIR